MSFLHPDDRENIIAIHRQALATGEPVITDLSTPIEGDEFQPGDLVRDSAAEVPGRRETSQGPEAG